MHEGDVLHYFPVHEAKELRELDKDWFKCFAWGSRIDKVREYFGEHIAFYFLFRSHFTKWLVIPALVGPVLWLIDIPLGTPDNFTEIPLMLGIAVWSSFFVHFWRRTSATYAIKWGTLDLQKTLEVTRSEFYGTQRINPVTE